ncbi:MAG TPA: PIN domain-containing protein [Flavobacteriaceae bacterium]|nr:PIN domain-containing protein [Flavobacteriaceae bacterium]
MFYFAHYDLYTPKWSNHIFKEWERVMIRKGIDKSEAKKRVQNANLAFPDAQVSNYERLINQLELPDATDRHVLAAAIKVNANVIVTNNLKDFPKDYLAEFSLTRKSADDYLIDIIDLNPQEAIEAFREMVLYKKSPPLDEFDVLSSLRKVQLKNTADYLHSLL